jgi:CBS domain containing-hemolysin-like protein
MTNILFEVTAIFLLIIANGIFAMSEMAIVAARKSRLKDWAERGNTGAKAALELADNPDQFFSTVQIGTERRVTEEEIKTLVRQGAQAGVFDFTRMGRVPSVADRLEWNNLRFEIVDMDGKRIDKVLVAQL